MLEKINLFPKVEAVWGKKVKTRRLVQMASIVALAVYFLLISSLISFFLLVKQEMASVQAKISGYQQELKLLQSREAKQFLLKEKLQELVKILESETGSVKALQSARALALTGINLTNVSYLGEELKLEGEAENVLVLDELVKSLEDMNSEKFAEIFFESVNKMETGRYQFEVLLKK